MRSFKHQVELTTLVLFMVMVVFAGRAAAQVPKPNVFDGGNRWLITAYDDTSPIHQQWATQGICFLPYGIVGTNIQGVWYSDTFPNWRGRYSQEGDHLRMHGNWANFGGSDAMELDLYAGPSPRDVAAGHWTEWWNFGTFGTTVGFANAGLRRVSKCPLPTNADTLSQAELEAYSLERSRSVSPRLRTDGKESDRPNDPEAVPLPEETQK
ncbi:MAG TPA: hypothetical protein VF654_11240 [Pyrinomonadaceae bacterium]